MPIRRTIGQDEAVTAASDLLLLDVPDSARPAHARLLGEEGAEVSVGGLTVALGLPGWATAPGLLLGGSDPEADARQLRRRGLPLPEHGPAATVADGLTWGIATAPARDTQDPVAGAATTEIAGLDHLVLGSPNRDRIIATLAGRLGFELRLDRVQRWGVHQLFFRRGELLVEVVLAESEDVDPAGPDTIYGLAWRTPDIDATVARLTAARVPTSEVRRGAKPGTRVATVKDPDLALPTIVIEQG
jgi:catechol 2,3-dioxygenase-like lactoylglutathione lyase family enzyme